MILTNAKKPDQILCSDKRSAITFCLTGICSTCIEMVNKADNIQIFLAHVANIAFFVLPDRRTSTTTMLSHLICIFLFWGIRLEHMIKKSPRWLNTFQDMEKWGD